MFIMGKIVRSCDDLIYVMNNCVEIGQSGVALGMTEWAGLTMNSVVGPGVVEVRLTAQRFDQRRLNVRVNFELFLGFSRLLYVYYF